MYYDDISMRSLSLRDLKEMYKVTKSQDIVDYVSRRFGLRGLYTIDVFLGLGAVIQLLEADPSVIANEIHTSSTEDLQSLLLLIAEVYRQFLTEDSQVYEDKIYANILYVIGILDLSQVDRNEKDAKKNINIIINFYRYLLGETIGLNNDKIYDNKNDVFVTDVAEAICNNKTVTEDFIFDTLKEFPVVAKYYIENYGNIITQVYLDATSGSNINRLVMSNRVLNFVTIIFLIKRLQDNILDYNESSTAIDPENYISDTIFNFLYNVEINEKKTSVKYLLPEISIGELFKDSMSSLIYKDESYIRLVRLFWSIWLYTKSGLLSTEEIDYLNEIYDIDLEQMYGIFYQWRREIRNGTSNGLFYTLYYRDLYEKDHLWYSDDPSHEAIDKEYKEMKDKALDKEILDLKYFTEPLQYLKEITVQFPTVELFREQDNASIKEAKITDESNLDDVLANSVAL